MRNQIDTCEALNLFGTVRTPKDIDEDFAIKYTTAMVWTKIDINDPLNGYKRFIVELLKRLSVGYMNELQKEWGEIERGTHVSIAKTINMPLRDAVNFSTSGIQWKKKILDFLMNIDVELLEFFYDSIKSMLSTQDFSDSDGVKREPIIKLDKAVKNPRKTPSKTAKKAEKIKPDNAQKAARTAKKVQKAQ